MPRGPRTPPEMRVRIVEIFLELRDRLQEEPTAKEVREALRQELERAKSPQAVPSLRQVQNILTQARDNVRALGNKDGPWSLVIPQDHGIPSDANGVLLEMWGYCRTINRNLTIRQAQWIDRLRSVPAAVQNHELLYTWACLYAGREKAASLAGQEMDTTDLDAYLAFDKKSHQAAVSTGVIPAVTRFIEDIAEVDPIWASIGLGRVPNIANLVFKGHHEQYQLHPTTAPLHQLQQDIYFRASSRQEAMQIQEGMQIIKSLWNVWRLWGVQFGRSQKLWSMSETEQEGVLQELASEMATWFRSTPPLSPESPDANNWEPSRELLNKAGLGSENQD